MEGSMILSIKSPFSRRLYAGTMTATIRSERKDRRRPKVGEPLLFYRGIGSNHVCKVGTAVCANCSSFVITREGVYLDGVSLDRDEIEAVVLRSGYESIDAFKRYWMRYHSVPFFGWLASFIDFEGVMLPLVLSGSGDRKPTDPGRTQTSM
jgi:hypothetical protein